MTPPRRPWYVSAFIYDTWQTVKRIETKVSELSDALDRLRNAVSPLRDALVQAQATIQQMTDADAAEDANYEQTIADLTDQLNTQVSDAVAQIDGLTDQITQAQSGPTDQGSTEVTDSGSAQAEPTQ